MKIKTTLLLTSVILLCATRIASAGDAAGNWNKYCASCHGKDGAGNTVMGKKNGVPDYRDAKAQAKFTDAEAINIITNGKEKMKAFKDKLTPDEIKDLVAFIRKFKQS